MNMTRDLIRQKPCCIAKAWGRGRAYCSQRFSLEIWTQRETRSVAQLEACRTVARGLGLCGGGNCAEARLRD